MKATRRWPIVALLLGAVVVAVVLLGVGSARASGGIITTVAGGGVGGDGGPATSASLNYPIGVVTDRGGNLYISDYLDCRVRKVTAGTITTIAGGTCGYGGDGGPASGASLGITHGLALDSSGNLYIGDQGNSRVRKVSGGTVTTIAGNGSIDYGGDGGPATSGSFSVGAIAVDSAGSLYIGDWRNSRVRKVSAGIITTVAGGGTTDGDGGLATDAFADSPDGVAVDTNGNVYIAQYNGCRVRKVTGGIITTVAGNGSCGDSGDGGAATSAGLMYPAEVTVDTAGNLYISEDFSCRIRKVSAGTITTIAGTGCGYSGDGGPATSASFARSPDGMAVDMHGNLYVADPGNHRVRAVGGIAASAITVLSPLVGNVQVRPSLGDCSGVPKWCFEQHPGVGLHTVGGGVCSSDDTLAWDSHPFPTITETVPVYAAAAGKIVAYAGSQCNSSGLGAVLVEHGWGSNVWWTGYLHMASVPNFSLGQTVDAGTLLGNVSNVGTTDRHLHFVVYAGTNSVGGLVSVGATIVPRISQSSLTSPASAGTSILNVGDISAYSLAEKVRINPGGADEEDGTIGAFGSLDLNALLQFDHASGEPVVAITAAAPSVGGVAEEPDVTQLRLPTSTHSSAPRAGYELAGLVSMLTAAAALLAAMRRRHRIRRMADCRKSGGIPGKAA